MEGDPRATGTHSPPPTHSSLIPQTPWDLPGVPHSGKQHLPWRQVWLPPSWFILLQAFQCSHSSCLPHFRARINGSGGACSGLKKDGKDVPSGEMEVSLIGRIIFFLIFDTRLETCIVTHPLLGEGQRTVCVSRTTQYRAVLCEHLVYSDSWPQVLDHWPS